MSDVLSKNPEGCVLTVAFFNHGNLVEKEILAALRKLPGVRLVVVPIVELASSGQAEAAARALREQGAGVLFTVNNWGLDAGAVLARRLEESKILHVNWHVDDPFYTALMHGLRFPPMPNRLDFVSDRGYVARLRREGYRARFLPLAASPEIFHPDDRFAPVRDVCFVGNSYRVQTDTYVKDCQDFMAEQVPFLTRLLALYAADMSHDVDRDISGQLAAQELPGGLTREKAAFIMKHFVGYLFRKRVVVSLAAAYPDFMAFGDEAWLCDLDPKRVSLAVGYYTNLCRTYLETRVNIDINRMVIRDGFTQRVFDCLASGSFIITSPKKVVAEYFVTEGPDQEVAVFQNELHLRELIDYFLKHDDEREAIARRGRAKVLAKHTYDHRIATIFSTLSQQLGRM